MAFSELWNKAQLLYKATHPDAELMLGGQNGEVYIAVVKNGEFRDSLVEQQANASIAIEKCVELLQSRHEDLLARKKEQMSKMENEILQLQSLLQ